MRGDEISNEHNVARYCKPLCVDEDLPLPCAFELRPVEGHLSVNWLEYFDEDNLKERMQRVREAFANKNYGLKNTGRFAVLNVAMIKAAGLNAANKQLKVLHWPDNENNDISHSGIFNYEISDFEIASEIAASITPDDMLPAILET